MNQERNFSQWFKEATGNEPYPYQTRFACGDWLAAPGVPVPVGFFKNLKSQIVISSWGGLRRAAPYAFTEQGVAMLSSVLRSRRAVQVNITIMRAFVKLRAMVTANKELADKLAELEHTVASHDEHFGRSSKPFAN